MSRLLRTDNSAKVPDPPWYREASADIAAILQDDQPEHLKTLDLIDLIAHYAQEIEYEGW